MDLLDDPRLGPRRRARGERGYLGFKLTSQGDRALVGDVAPDGPGGKAGVKSGDVVVAFNGVPFHFDGDLALLQGLEWVRPGVPVDLTLLRNGKKIEVGVVPGRFKPADLAALEDWLRRAELTRRAQQRACALDSFKALAAPPGIEVSFKKDLQGGGYSQGALRHELPPDLDLSDPFLTHLLGRLRPGDSATLRYEWRGNALRSEVVQAPGDIDLEEVSRKALDQLKAAGATVRDRD